MLPQVGAEQGRNSTVTVCMGIEEVNGVAENYSYKESLRNEWQQWWEEYLKTVRALSRCL